jgi:hypothetical protein
LPPIVARPWIWVEPISSTASTTPGHACLSCACSPNSAPLTAAPMRKPPSSATMRRNSVIFFTSTTSPGSIRSDLICTKRSVPPASTRASPLAPASNATAASSVSGASYRILTMVLPCVLAAGGPAVPARPRHS